MWVVCIIYCECVTALYPFLKVLLCLPMLICLYSCIDLAVVRLDSSSKTLVSINSAKGKDFRFAFAGVHE